MHIYSGTSFPFLGKYNGTSVVLVISNILYGVAVCVFDMCSLGLFRSMEVSTLALAPLYK